MRKILWKLNTPAETTPAPDSLESEPIQTDPQPTHVVETASTITVVKPKRAYKQRTGNGHSIQKTRDLTEMEKDNIKAFFLSKNGQIDTDDCVLYKKGMFSEVAIFQVTGFVSLMHVYVAEGKLTLNNLVSYEKWMSEKYGNVLWARYNLPKYVAVREANQEQIALGFEPTFSVNKKKPKQTISVSPTPKFAAFPRKGTV